MKFPIRLLAPLCALAALFMSGCSSGDNFDKALDDFSAQLDKWNTTVSKVTDKASAEKAGTDSKAIAADMKKVATRFQALGQPTVDVEAKVRSKMQAIVAKFSQGNEALSVKLKSLPPEAVEALKTSTSELPKAMQEVAEAMTAADKK